MAGKRKRDSPNEELRRDLLDRMRNPDVRGAIADTLIKAVTGKEAKGIGDVIKGYEKIVEIIGHDPMEDGSGLTVRELSRLSDERLQAMLERLQ